ncbi:hypothetical protein EUGRSUZ_F01404 [Eucalyptus grandis]|uniref:Uncharacterized protein n=2 Tax=Eucalyptus grandis TaxID=71139 RepID=A0ACC3KDS0_EUCGR|nr:hypothetical protein EUGRSUZ_F01404 [Eucalyptus grandis]
MALLVFGRDYEYKPEAFDSGRLPVTLSREMQMFLDVTNLIQCENPRAAYLCRQYAFEITWKLDHNSIGQGGRQFKTSLHH